MVSGYPILLYRQLELGQVSARCVTEERVLGGVDSLEQRFAYKPVLIHTKDTAQPFPSSVSGTYIPGSTHYKLTLEYCYDAKDLNGTSVADEPQLRPHPDIRPTAVKSVCKWQKIMTETKFRTWATWCSTL